ncbi:MAG: AAA family ATPase, partial [Gammaproteobacteria bacterium]
MIVTEILSRFQGVRQRGKGWLALCPAHDDHEPSLSIGLSGDKILVRCRAGCQTNTVLEKAALSMKDLFGDSPRASNGQHHARRIVRTFDYCDEAGTVLFQVVRYEPKEFRQRRPDGPDWIWNMKDARRVLYRLPALLADPAQLIVVHEGETACEAAIAAGLPGCHTTTSGGASNGHLTDLSPCIGRHVVICADLDDAGEHYATTLAARLLTIGATSVKIVRWPEVPEHGDAVEWLQNGGTPAQFDLLCEQAREEEQEVPEADNSFRAYRPGPLHESNFHPLQASELLAEVPEPVEWVIEDFLPTGSLGLIAGKPKEGKTTLVYELCVKVAQGLPFLGRTTKKGGALILAVEEHRRDVTLRLQGLGAEGLDGLYVHVGALAPTPTFFTELLT